MRVLLLIVLMLAGCATPAKQPPANSGANVKPVRERAMPAPAPAVQPQEAEPQQTEIPEPPKMVKGWIDVSGQGRDDAALYRDSAACHVIYKRAVREALQLYPEPLPDRDCGDCGTRNAEAARLRQQNIRNHADAAYTECMESKGWRRK